MRLQARLALAAGVLLAAALPARAQTPDYEGEFFTDFTHQIPARTGVEISKTLRVGAQQSKIHPMLVVIDRMSNYPAMPQDIGPFATKLVNDWRIGDVDTHKGVLALFSVADHKFYVEHTDQLDRAVSDEISAAFKRGGTTDALKANDLARAMTRAADAIATALPHHASTSSGGGGGGQPVHTVTTTTHTHQVQGSPPVYHSSGSSGHSFGGCFVMIIGIAVVLWVVTAVLGSLSGTSRGYGGNYGGYGYGGGGYGGGGGGGFWSGMFTGGLMGYMFGNSGSSYGSGWGSGWGSSGGSGWYSGGSQDTSYTDTTTTETWSSGGGSSDSSSYSSGGDSGGSSFDSFGGGGSSGDSGSGGSW